jgi:hypothetical protein
MLLDPFLLPETARLLSRGRAQTSAGNAVPGAN